MGTQARGAADHHHGRRTTGGLYCPDPQSDQEIIAAPYRVAYHVILGDIMDVEVGSNLYRNTDGTIEIEGVPQIEVTQHPSTGALLVNFVVFDANGRMLAKVVDSTMMFNERRAFDITKTDKSVTVMDAASGKILLQLDVKTSNVVSFSRGEFHTMKGHVLEVSAKEWKIDKLKKSGLTQDAKGGAVSIG